MGQTGNDSKAVGVKSVLENNFTFVPQVGHFWYVSSLAISPDGEFIVSGSWNGRVKVWRMSDGELVRTLKGHSAMVNSVGISPDGEFIVSGSEDGTIKVWRISEGTLFITLVADGEGHWAVWTPNGFWDADSTGKSVGVSRVGTLEIYKPGDSECDALRYKGLLSYIWQRDAVPIMTTATQVVYERTQPVQRQTSASIQEMLKTTLRPEL